jgi:hypothetical protein
MEEEKEPVNLASVVPTQNKEQIVEVSDGKRPPAPIRSQSRKIKKKHQAVLHGKRIQLYPMKIDIPIKESSGPSFIDRQLLNITKTYLKNEEIMYEV